MTIDHHLREKLKALKLSGMHKKNFYTKIKELGLAMKDFASPRHPRE